jgi:hypothetical protein
MGHDRLGDAKQQQLIGGIGGGQVEVRYGHAEQPDALGSRKQRAHEFEARLTQQIVASDHCSEAAASGDLWKSANFAFTVTVRP